MLCAFVADGFVVKECWCANPSMSVLLYTLMKHTNSDNNSYYPYYCAHCYFSMTAWHSTKHLSLLAVLFCFAMGLCTSTDQSQVGQPQTVCLAVAAAAKPQEHCCVCVVTTLMLQDTNSDSHRLQKSVTTSDFLLIFFKPCSYFCRGQQLKTGLPFWFRFFNTSITVSISCKDDLVKHNLSSSGIIEVAGRNLTQHGTIKIATSK